MVYTSYVYWKNKGCLLFLWCFDMYSCYDSVVMIGLIALPRAAIVEERVASLAIY